jgi:hypothetical protein
VDLTSGCVVTVGCAAWGVPAVAVGLAGGNVPIGSSGVCPAEVVGDESGEFVRRDQCFRGELVGVEVAAAGEVGVEGQRDGRSGSRSEPSEFGAWDPGRAGGCGDQDRPLDGSGAVVGNQPIQSGVEPL